MTLADLRAWQAHMGYTYATAAKSLGVARSTYATWISGEREIDKRTELACAAIAAKLQPFGSKK
jgi:DNA-binding XRE family transcriptional regulator